MTLAVVLQIPIQRRTDGYAVVPSQDDLVTTAFDLEHVAPLVSGDDFDEECVDRQDTPHDIAGRLFRRGLSLRLLHDEDSSKNPTYQTGFSAHGLADWFRSRLNCLPARALFNVLDPKVKTDEELNSVGLTLAKKSAGRGRSFPRWQPRPRR